MSDKGGVCAVVVGTFAACVNSGLHRHVTLLAKPAAACIIDYSVKTPLKFEAGVGGQLLSAGLDVAVQLEVTQQQLLGSGQLRVAVDLLLPEGTVLLQDLQTTLQQVSTSLHVLHHLGNFYQFPGGSSQWHSIAAKEQITATSRHAPTMSGSDLHAGAAQYICYCMHQQRMSDSSGHPQPQHPKYAAAAVCTLPIFAQHDQKQ